MTDAERALAAPFGPPAKRHILTGTCACLIFTLAPAAGIQDRDGAADVQAAVRTRFPRFRHVFAEGAYAGGNSRLGMRNFRIRPLNRS